MRKNMFNATSHQPNKYHYADVPIVCRYMRALLDAISALPLRSSPYYSPIFEALVLVHSHLNDPLFLTRCLSAIPNLQELWSSLLPRNYR